MINAEDAQEASMYVRSVQEEEKYLLRYAFDDDHPFWLADDTARLKDTHRVWVLTLIWALYALRMGE